MKLLAIDTSTDACSVALWFDGETLSRSQVSPRQHADIILPMLDSLLGEGGVSLTQLDVIAMSCGPGAFTGLRIAAGVTQALAYAEDIPVVKVSTLTTMAQQAWRKFGHKKVLAGLDARLQEVYWSACSLNNEGYMEPETEECVCLPEAIPQPGGNDWFGVGSAWSSYKTILASHLRAQCVQWDAECYPDAVDVAALGAYQFDLGQAVTACQVLPVYLRNNVVDRR